MRWAALCVRKLWQLQCEPPRWPAAGALRSSAAARRGPAKPESLCTTAVGGGLHCDSHVDGQRNVNWHPPHRREAIGWAGQGEISKILEGIPTSNFQFVLLSRLLEHLDSCGSALFFPFASSCNATFLAARTHSRNPAQARQNLARPTRAAHSPQPRPRNEMRINIVRPVEYQLHSPPHSVGDGGGVFAFDDEDLLELRGEHSRHAAVDVKKRLEWLLAPPESAVGATGRVMRPVTSRQGG